MTEQMLEIALIITVAALATALLEGVRMYARRRRHDLDKAREALDRHFTAMEHIVSDKTAHNARERE